MLPAIVETGGDHDRDGDDEHHEVDEGDADGPDRLGSVRYVRADRLGLIDNELRGTGEMARMAPMIARLWPSGVGGGAVG